MAKQERHFQIIPRDEPRLLEGVRLFNVQQYFQSHEVWESLWHEVGGKERELLQGLIQIAAAYHHLSRGNTKGARYLYGKGRARIVSWGPFYAGINLGKLLSTIDQEFASPQHDRGARTAPSISREL